MDVRRDRVQRLLLAFGLWLFLTLFFCARPFFQDSLSLLSFAGSAILSLAVTFAIAFYLRLFLQAIYYSLSRLSLLLSVLVLTCIIAFSVSYFFSQNFPLFLPFPVFLTCLLLGEHVSLLTGALLSVILMVALPLGAERFLSVNFLGAIATILFTRRMYKHKEVFAICFKVWLLVAGVITSFYFFHNSYLPHDLLTDLSYSAVALGITGLLVIFLLPLFESLFHIVTDMTLMEYLSPNHPLMRRLSMEAPGTYQHSLVIGNLAERAAISIGANGLFCRVSTLYHDIGKLNNPHYYAENQLGGFNIHPLLTPQESAQVIMAHVAEGEALARKYGLPQSFIDIITEHHGTTLVYYFYRKLIDQKGIIIDEKHFRYPGPKPQSKESAIIMIADCIEAASRSLDEVTEQILTEMVEKIAFDKIADHQFDEAPLTFEELTQVKKSFIRTLMVSSHLRIKYPEKS